MKSLDARAVLVVGASSGIGRAIGVAAAKAGARVALAARRGERCREAAEEAGQDAIALECDVRDSSSCDAVVANAVVALGKLDALVYAAGVSPLTRLADADAGMWRSVLETNLVGAGLVCRAALPHLQRSRGRAIFLSSSSVGRPYPSLSIYAASKAALEEMIRGWRAENPETCFSCVVVGPTTGTEFGHGWDPELTAQTLRFWAEHGYDAGGAPMRVGDIAAAVVEVLASPVCVWTVRAHGDPGNSAPPMGRGSAS